MLTAWMRHASRTKCSNTFSGERVSNTWVICLQLGNNGWKRPLIPNVVVRGIFNYQSGGSKDLAVDEEPMRYQLVGRVMAYQGYDV